MKDNQKSKDHIRAARDWLGDAEHSLDQDDEIRGDLKVMLAKAELSQVHEGEQTQAVKRWFRRMAPLAAAVCITAAGFAGWQSISHMSDTPATSADAGGANRPDMPKPLPPAAPAAPQTQKQAAADAPAADAAPAAPAEAAVPAATPAQEPPADRVCRMRRSRNSCRRPDRPCGHGNLFYAFPGICRLSGRQDLQDEGIPYKIV